MKFKSDLGFAGEYREGKDINQNRLPQLYRADVEFAYKQGNEQLNDLLDNFGSKVRGEFKYISIDLRTHMLMTNMFPCIPGWHCDDFHRTEALNGQPDLENLPPMRHWMMVLGDCSMTEFLLDDISLPSPTQIQKTKGNLVPLYYEYDKMIETLYPSSLFVKPNCWYIFGPQAFHRGSAATKNGWRTFIRITLSNHREPKNELRYQTQVYTTGRVSW